MPDQPRDLIFRTVVSFLITFAFLLLALFLPAGRIAWANGWLFFLVFFVLMVLAAVYLWRTNPDIFVARSRIHRGTKRWDKVFTALLLPAIMAIFPVAALDGGRFHWSHVPLGIVVLGYVLLIVGFVITIWVERVNKFAEPTVRIHSGQTVIDTGPYAIVRHPMCSSAILMFVGIPLVLGSYWALIPAATTALILLPRTIMEDRALRTELPGYSDYAHRVRYRLIPGIW